MIDEYGGGVWKGRKAKAAIPGGISMGLMTEAEFDTPLDFDGPGRVGCLGLGTAAVVVLDETVPHRRLPAQQLPLLRARELRPVHALPRRHGLVAEDARIASRPAAAGCEIWICWPEIGDSIGIIPGTTICGLADGAAWPIKNAIRKFRGEFEEYIKRTNPQRLRGDRARSRALADAHRTAARLQCRRRDR